MAFVCVTKLICQADLHMNICAARFTLWLRMDARSFKWTLSQMDLMFREE